MLNDLTETFVCSVDRAEVNEQIAVALVRLQQDMHSVLTRLNTLEALSVAQTRIRSRTPSENERERQAQVGTTVQDPLQRFLEIGAKARAVSFSDVFIENAIYTVHIEELQRSKKQFIFAFSFAQCKWTLTSPFFCSKL